MKKNYLVEGMSCEGCARAVMNAIQEADPGTRVEVDLPAKRVTVAGIDDDDLVRRAVEKAGYSYGGLS
jgi:copper chaperone